MSSVVVGTIEIPYTMRRSRRAKHYRITVAPEKVELVVPRRGNRRDAQAFLEERRFWIYEKLHQLRSLERGPRFPERFVDGALIPFRGRRVRLRVRDAEGTGRRGATVRYRGGFDVELPAGLDEETRERRTRRAVEGWLDERALADAWGWAEKYEPRLGARPKAFLLRRQKTRWASCAADGTIRLNRLLMAAPKRSFEYVVVHELCHLRVRDHSPRFWKLVERLMPDYRRHQIWFSSRGASLD